jgi:hypothetical protein
VSTSESNESEQPPAVVAAPGGAPVAATESAAATRWRHLPPQVSWDDLVAVHETEPAPDPEMGRDTDRDFMLRYPG